MVDLWTWLSQSVEGTWAVALSASFVWGILSVLLSPCHLAAIPLIVAFINGQGKISTKRSLALSSLFAAGIMVTIAVIGLATHAAGRVLGDIGGWVNYLAAALFFLVGLHLLDILPVNFSGPGQVAFRRKGMLAALVFGLLFGLALGPCTFTYMIPMLAIALKAGGEDAAYGTVLLLMYGLGHCLVIALAGTFTGSVQRYLNWTEKSRGSVYVRRICGCLILLGGLYLIYLA